ncbi:hypothetical protein CROQUDRAFT_718315 [Cronartium quercuum f. sp. fusiforme G11]|uniref:Uncharacterized protein n=1 Tax=Cronartium quercuum f. sp. fusiforme G11 TaxID=708437 RepID=A0A9P6T751_9BASI|nr:hypothetical protein CROQUDRAFT_718315 [Cronartium quercuum f. sp. fusiforme G11]
MCSTVIGFVAIVKSEICSGWRGTACVVGEDGGPQIKFWYYNSGTRKWSASTRGIPANLEESSIERFSRDLRHSGSDSIPKSTWAKTLSNAKQNFPRTSKPTNISQGPSMCFELVQPSASAAISLTTSFQQFMKNLPSFKNLTSLRLTAVAGVDLTPLPHTFFASVIRELSDIKSIALFPIPPRGFVRNASEPGHEELGKALASRLGLKTLILHYYTGPTA